MNGLTIFIWIAIAIIGIISVIAVKMHYKGNELETDELSALNENKSINKMISAGQSLFSRNTNDSKSTHSNQLDKFNVNDIGNDKVTFKETLEEPDIEPIIPDHQNNNIKYESPNQVTADYENTVEKFNVNDIGNDRVTFKETLEEPDIEPIIPDHQNNNIKYESPNQVTIDYENTVEKFQEPIKESQMNIMNQNNNPDTEKHELKDLFTIDELIKESKRKDSEREKETISHEDDEEINELKESIKQRQNNEKQDALIEEIIENHEETINEIIEDVEAAENAENADDIVNDANDIVEETESEQTAEIETPTITSQEIEEVINTASQETEEEVESISESTGITDVLLDSTEEEIEEEIKEPILKTPTKVSETNENGAESNDTNASGKYDNELDYRKDLDKIRNTIKGSKIFQDVKEKLISEPNNIEINDTYEENYIRNVNEYEDEFEPIINETHSDFEATYEEYHKDDDLIRQQNTQKVFNMAKNTPEPEPAESKISPIKEKPPRDNIKVQINNNEVVLKKGDEIIFNHDGDTYSSQVYAINGDDISVKYRRQNITIKPSDVKKVY